MYTKYVMSSYEFVVCYNEVITMYTYNVNVILTVYHKIELVEKIQAPVT